MEGLPKKTAKAHRTPLWDGVVSRNTPGLDTWDRGKAGRWSKHCHNHEADHETQVISIVINRASQEQTIVLQESKKMRWIQLNLKDIGSGRAAGHWSFVTGHSQTTNDQ